MKKFNYLFLLLCYISIGYSQEKMYKISYAAEYLPFTKKPNAIEVDAQKKAIQDQYIAEYKNVEMELIFSKSKSVFRAIDKLQAKENMYYDLAKIQITGDQTYYLDIEAKTKCFFLNFEGENTLVYEDYRNLTWLITNETMLINGLNCIRATALATVYQGSNLPDSKMSVDVWFCPQIVGSFGPRGFGGLPGVILSCIRNNVRIFATKIEEIMPQEIKVPTASKVYRSVAEYEKAIELMYSKYR